MTSKNGKLKMVILDAACDERQLKTATLAHLLAEGEADIKAGRTQPYEDFIKEFRRAKKISD